MRRYRYLAPATLLGVATLATMLAAVAPARPAADDVSIEVFLRAGNTLTTTPGPSFQIVAEVSTTAGVAQAVTITIALPLGLSWGSNAPDPTAGCTGTAPAVCTSTLSAGGSGTVGGFWLWDVVAERPGIYEITASVVPTEADPDMSNNTDTFRFEVVQPTGGGETGGGGSATASAGAVKLTPARPKAGSTVAAVVRVTAGGVPVRPSGITCGGTIGTAKLKGIGKATIGTASCLYRTPRTARGKTLRGAVSFTARSTKFAKRFSIKLG